MTDTQRLISSAFRSRDWGGALEAWFEALGVSVLVIDSTQDIVLRSGPRTGYCHLVHGDFAESAPFDCLSGGAASSVCAGGTPYRLLPLTFRGEVVARLMICGYTTSAEERRKVGSRLSASGMSADHARAIVRGIPVIPKRRLAAVERMVVHQASAILENAVSETVGGPKRLIESLGAAVRGAASSADDLTSVAAWMLDYAIEVVDGTGGSISLLDYSSGELRTLVERGEHGPADSVAARRAFRSARTTVGAVPAFSHIHRSSACIPLMIDQRRIGVVCVTLRAADLNEGTAELERFVASAVNVLDAVASRQARDREVFELMQVGEVARVLHKGVEVNDIGRLVAGVLEKAIDMSIGGIALTAYGTDRAALVVNGTVSQPDIESVVAEAVGRESSGGLQIDVASHLGEIVQTDDPARDWTVLSEPLIIDDAVIGFLFAARTESHGFGAEDRRLLERLGTHVAVAFNRSALFARLSADYTRAIEVLSAALDASEGMKLGHSGQVMEYAMRIGEEMSLRMEDIEILRFAGLVHDIGKIGISEEVLLKPTRLSEEEMAEVRRHSEIGATLLEQVGFLNAVAPVVLHHHEHWDGTGYPMQLSGEDIPLMARILAVADAYASMTADTPYRPALSFRRAESEIVAGAGSVFDPRVVAAMTMVLQRMQVAGLTGMMRETEDWGGQHLPA